jgi:hypothetical protein
MDVYQQLSAHWRAKKSWGVALQLVAAQAVRVHPGSKGSRVLTWWDELVRQNAVDFADAVDGFVPPLERVILACAPGDKGLALVIRFIEDDMDKAGMRAKATIYPAVLLVFFIVSQMFMGYHVLPGLLHMVGHAPAWGTALVWASRLCWLPLVPVVGIAVWANVTRYSWTGPRRWWCDAHLPPWKTWRMDEVERFLLAWAALWDTGKLSELEIARRICEFGTPWLAERLGMMIPHLAGGKSLGEAAWLAGDFPTPELIASILSFEAMPKDMAGNMRIAAETLRRRRVVTSTQFYTIFGMGFMLVVILAALGSSLIVITQLNLPSLMDALQNNL